MNDLAAYYKGHGLKVDCGKSMPIYSLDGKQIGTTTNQVIIKLMNVLGISYQTIVALLDSKYKACKTRVKKQSFRVPASLRVEKSIGPVEGPRGENQIVQKLTKVLALDRTTVIDYIDKDFLQSPPQLARAQGLPIAPASQRIEKALGPEVAERFRREVLEERPIRSRTRYHRWVSQCRISSVSYDREGSSKPQTHGGL